MFYRRPTERANESATISARLPFILVPRSLGIEQELLLSPAPLSLLLRFTSKKRFRLTDESIVIHSAKKIKRFSLYFIIFFFNCRQYDFSPEKSTEIVKIKTYLDLYKKTALLSFDYRQIDLRSFFFRCFSANDIMFYSVCVVAQH